MEINKIAFRLYDSLETATRDDGSKYLRVKDYAPKWVKEVIDEVHGDVVWDDTVMEFIQQSASDLSECSDGRMSDYEQAISEMDGDVYFHDLSRWLATSINHASYVDAVLEEKRWKDIEILLRAAQRRHIQEVGHKLLRALQEIIDDLEEMLSEYSDEE